MCSRAFIHCWLLCASSAIILTAIGASSADQVGNKEALQKAFNENAQRREQLFTGQEQAKAGDAKIATAAANFYLHRITNTSENPLAIQKDFTNAIFKLEKAPSSRAFVNYFAPALVNSMKEVFANNNVKVDGPVVVNAAMMLPMMARLQDGAINDYLIFLIQDEKGTHDVVRHYALKALREVMPIRVQLDTDSTLSKFEDFNDASQNARRKYDAKNVNALAGYIEYIERPRKPDTITPGQIEIVRFLRREAIISLAQAGAPAVSALKKPVKMEGLVAPVLLKVLAGDVEPSPSMSEQIEAALGLCAMRYPNMPDYNPEIAHFLIGRTLKKFTTEYNKDLINFAIVGAKKQVPYLFWKGEANRLKSGLKQLADNSAKIPAARTSAEQLEIKFGPIFNSISTYKNVGGERVQDLDEYLPRITPKDSKVFKNLPKAPEIKLSAP